MRVLLINPWRTDVLPPPSIGYLQSAVKLMCPDVEVMARDLKEAYALLDKEQFDLVGVTFHSFSVVHAKEIRRRVKGRLICGGHHPTALPEQLLSLGYDEILKGEGENLLVSLIKGVPDTYFHSVNDYPVPDYTGLGFNGNFGINIISSRGCPYACSFCASSLFWGAKYRMRSANNVITEVQQRLSEGFKTWIFEDDNFTAHRQRTVDICKGLDGGHTWQCQGRAESLDEDLCHALYDAGCRRIYLGIESLSQGSLDRCGKNTTVAKMIRGINNAEKAGIKTMCMFIVGLPGDTIEDIQETHRQRIKLPISEVGSNIAWILPGTDIHAKAKEQGFDDNVYLSSGAPFYTYEQPMSVLNQWKDMI